MGLSDEQLMLLTQLNSISAAYNFAEITKGNFNSVKGIVSQFNEEILKKLDEMDKNGVNGSSGEWAAIIRAIKEDEELMNLKITSRDEESGGTCYINSDSPNEAIVVFDGSRSNGFDWPDDVEGFDRADTAGQVDAADYIEELPYDSITVAGHSKGGNKAQYVAVVCGDKITNCVSMDGQGFSGYFTEKYHAEIAASEGKIKNYSVSDDYVHALLYKTPGSEQIYVEGSNEKGICNHSNNAFFQYVQDENGQWHIVKNDNGDPNIIITQEESIITWLHEFTCLLLTMPDEKKKDCVSYLSVIIKVCFDEGAVVFEGIEYTKENILELFINSPETGMLLLAYMVKFMDINNLSGSEIESFCSAFGLSELQKEIEFIIKGLISDSDGYDIIDFLSKNLSDGEDHILNVLFWGLKEWLEKKFGYVIDIEKLWDLLEKEFQEIGYIDSSCLKNDPQVIKGKIYDYSRRIYEMLLATIHSIGSNTFGSVASWNEYAGEDWFDSLSVALAVKGINHYFDKLSEIGRDCEKQIEDIFQRISDLDKSYSDKAATITEVFGSLTDQVNVINDSIIS